MRQKINDQACNGQNGRISAAL